MPKLPAKSRSREDDVEVRFSYDGQGPLEIGKIFVNGLVVGDVVVMGNHLADVINWLKKSTHVSLSDPPHAHQLPAAQTIRSKTKVGVR